jgi:hypothetical protein
MVIWDLDKKNQEGIIKKVEFNDAHQKEVNAID